MSRDQSHLDNPERCASPDESPSDRIRFDTDDRDPMDAYKDRLEMEDAERARNALIDTGRFGEVEHGKDYPGSLILDCASVIKQAALRAHSDFCRTHGMPEQASTYSKMAEAFKPKDE